MADLTINFVDEPLRVLLKAAKDYPHAHLDFSVAYISAIGVSWLQPLLKSAKRVLLKDWLSILRKIGR
ncbi:MAG TPA: hypothetical protein VFA41_01865 [Ktedonobacteraceae bacterium]|jgi:hypothetical protein|nr:hypothetical protein [Ktedonobacteraceae bacterium]